MAAAVRTRRELGDTPKRLGDAQRLLVVLPVTGRRMSLRRAANAAGLGRQQAEAAASQLEGAGLIRRQTRPCDRRLRLSRAGQHAQRALFDGHMPASPWTVPA
jgi:DNA-binding MarR family transcriptional regulator